MGVRADIREAIRKDLLTINSGGGYSLAVKKVAKKFIPRSKVEAYEMPFISMVSGDSEVEDFESGSYVDWNIILECHLRVTLPTDDSDALETEMDKFFEDCLKLFDSEGTNIEDHVRFLEVRTYTPNPYNDGDIATCWVGLQLQYIHEKT